MPLTYNATPMSALFPAPAHSEWQSDSFVSQLSPLSQEINQLRVKSNHCNTLYFCFLIGVLCTATLCIYSWVRSFHSLFSALKLSDEIRSRTYKILVTHFEVERYYGDILYRRKTSFFCTKIEGFVTALA